MSRILVILYGFVAYALAMGSIVYAVGFVANLWVPKSIDSGVPGDITGAVIINLLLLGLFAIQHSVMARPEFKRVWTSIIPPVIERSTYVLLSALVLILLYQQWRPIPDEVWRVDNEAGALVLLTLYFLGWGIVVFSTFLISHGELFGVQHVMNYWRGNTPPKPEFRTPLLYQLVRHPIYFGFLLAFWATPVMTIGHLLFAVAATGYILIGAFLEERDLESAFGESYRSYRQRVPMLVPWQFWRRPGG